LLEAQELEENWLELLDESYEFRRSTDFISENFTGVETYEYSLDSGREGGVTDIGFLREIDAFAEWYRAQPEVAHVFGVSDIMKRLNRNLHGDDPDYHVLPDDSDLAAQYLLLYEFSLPVGRDLNNLIDVDRAATRVTVVLKSLSTREKIELDERAQAWFRQNAPDLETGATGVAVVGARSIQRNIEGMLLGTIVAMAIVSLLLLFVFRSVRLGLISLIPNFVPAAMAMGLWGYAVGEVGVAASVVTAIAFGIIVDNDGFIAEACVLNVCSVSHDGVFVTPPFEGILHGTTMRRLLDLARNQLSDEGLLRTVEQRPLRADEARAGAEVIMSGGDTHVFPVVEWDGASIGDGTVGPVAKRLHELITSETEAGDGSPDDFIEVQYA